MQNRCLKLGMLIVLYTASGTFIPFINSRETVAYKKDMVIKQCHHQQIHYLQICGKEQSDIQ